MAYNVYDNPNTVALGSYSCTGCTQIAVSQTAAVIQAAGDSDVYAQVADSGTITTSGTISTVDPEESTDMIGLTGTLSFVATAMKGGTNKTCTITGVTITGTAGNVQRDAASGGTVNWVARSTDGTTNPISWA